MKLSTKLPYNYEPNDCGISPQSSIETLQRYMAYTTKVSVVETPDDYYFVNLSNDYGDTLEAKYNIFAKRFGLI